MKSSKSTCEKCSCWNTKLPLKLKGGGVCECLCHQSKTPPEGKYWRPICPKAGTMHLGCGICVPIKPPPPSTAEGWEEEFDAGLAHIPEVTREEIKHYIKTVFIPLSTLHTLEDKIGGMKMSRSQPEAISISLVDGFNGALDSVLQEIRKMYE